MMRSHGAPRAHVIRVRQVPRREFRSLGGTLMRALELLVFQRARVVRVADALTSNDGSEGFDR